MATFIVLPIPGQSQEMLTEWAAGARPIGKISQAFGLAPSD